MGAAAAAPIIAGGLSYLGSQKQAKALGKAGKQADPFAPYRSQYAELLSQLYGFAPKEAPGGMAGAGTNAPSDQLRQLRTKLQVTPINQTMQRQELTEQIKELTAQEQQQQQAAPPVSQGAPSGQGASDFIMNLPGLRYAIEAANKATSRAAAASGMGRSGNLLAEISGQTAGLVQSRAGEELDRLARLSGAGAVGGGAGYTAEAGAARAQPLSDIGALIGRYAPSFGGAGGGGSVGGATFGVPNLSTAGAVDIFGSPNLGV